MGAAGLAVLFGCAWLLAKDRPAIAWRTVIGGILLQGLLAALLIGFPPARHAMLYANDAADALQRATDAGTAFVFGFIGGAPLPFVETRPGASYILAFRALPLVLVISALSTLLIHWGVLQWLLRGFSALLRRTLGIGGALALGAAAHVFVGMIEAPLLIRPWLSQMSRGELFALMSCGMAGVAGTVMVIYGAILGPVIPDALGNIITAAIISTPAALAIAGLMIPAGPPRDDEAELILPNRPHSWVDAITRGTMDGIGPLVAIIALLLVSVALVALANAALALIPPVWDAPITLQRIASLPFRPILWLIGIPWPETAPAATLMGTKTILNEFVAYLNLAALPPETLSPKSRLIVTYAMCGFANLASVGILVGGMSAMAPERRREITALGLRSLLSGTLATCTSGAWVGVLVGG
jgi:CNT family concentrative nucleoside transporter